MKDHLSSIVSLFEGKKVVVVGDFVADEYILGMTSRVSREAPVLILKYDSTILQPGGGANAVNNIHALGGEVLPVGVLGTDDTGKKLVALLQNKGVDTSSIVFDPHWITPTKTRILAGGSTTTKQQVIRIDREGEPSVSKEVEAALLENFKKEAEEADGVIVSDYGLGALPPSLVAEVNRLSSEGEKIVVVDCRFDLVKYQEATAVTPNTEEVEWAMGVTLNHENIHETGRVLLHRLQSKGLLMTRGKEGMILLEKGDKCIDIDIYGSDEVADVTGAGDTVISAFTLALAAGAEMIEAARIANYAGGLVVMKSGTATVSREEILKAIEDDKKE